MTSLAEALRAGEHRLRPASESARLDAEVLLAHVLGKPRSYLVAWPARALEAQAGDYYRTLLEARADGRPVAYLVGEREFFSLRLSVDEHTLIPRPETELLVELAADLARRHGARRILDLGTGSGAIALALAHADPRRSITASDVSAPALQRAGDNARRLGCAGVRFVLSDWYAAIDERFEIIVANPPYVASTDPHLARGDLRYEPRLALDGGADGLDCLRVIVAGAPAHLLPGGWLAVEHGFDQAAAVRSLFEAAGFERLRSARDLAGQDRATLGVAP